MPTRRLYSRVELHVTVFINENYEISLNLMLISFTFVNRRCRYPVNVDFFSGYVVRVENVPFPINVPFQVFLFHYNDF